MAELPVPHDVEIVHVDPPTIKPLPSAADSARFINRGEPDAPVEPIGMPNPATLTEEEREATAAAWSTPFRPAVRQVDGM
jgi:hypothetical protein